jgi:hypothetical protein
MRAPREDRALADAIVLEGMGSGTIEHGAADELVRTESCKGNVREKRKENKPNLMPTRHQSRYFPVALTQATIAHAAKTSIPRPPTEKAKGGEAAGAGAIARPKSRSILSSACRVGWR